MIVLGLVLLIAATPAGAGVSARAARTLVVFVRENPRAADPNVAVDLWLAEPERGKPRRLAGGKGWDEAPSWSPDGRVIAFQKSLFEQGEPDLTLRSLDVWTVRSDGGGLRNVTRDGSASAPTWSPDGRRLAFGRGDGVYVVRPDGSRRVRVARKDDPGTAVWSPDGRRLAFAVPGELRVVASNGRGGRLVARGAASGSSVSWSPDGRLLGYSGARGATLVPWRGGRPRVLGKAFVETAWSPDGHWLALVREGAAREAGVFLLRTAGGKPRRLTRGLDTELAWSPDSRKLVFRRGLLIGDVYVVDVEGRGLRNLTRTRQLDEREPAWRPR